MAPVPKRHHFVPTFLIRHFADEERLVWYLDKDVGGDRIEQRNPTKVLFESHLYTTIAADGTKDVSQEHAFGELENAIAPTIRKIIEAARKRQRPGLSNNEKAAWDVFLYEQWRRVPDLRSALFTPELLQGIVDQTMDGYELRHGPLTQQDKRFLNDEAAMERVKANAMVSALGRRSENVLEVLSSRSLAVLLVDQANKSFILGSRPVVKLTPHDETHLANPRVEMWLPVAPDVAVGLGNLSGGEIMVTAPTPWVRRMNMAILGQSSQVVSRSRALLSSLIHRR